MKAQILKIAGVKNEKEFYKKFPTEEAFMAKHGGAFKKAQMGAYIGGKQDVNSLVNYSDIYDQNDKYMTGSTNTERAAQMQQQQQLASQQSQGGGGGFDLSKIDPSMLEGLMGKNGIQIPKAQTGFNGYDPQAGFPGAGFSGSMGPRTLQPVQNVQTQTAGVQLQSKGPQTSDINSFTPKAEGIDVWDTVGKAAGVAGELYGGYKALREERKQRLEAQQMAEVTDLGLQASRTRPEITERRYNMPTDNITTGEEFFPINGVGTNPLAKYGVNIPKAQSGFNSFMTGQGGNMLSQTAGSAMGNDGGSQIGGTLGRVGGTMIGGPVGGKIGEIVGKIGGGLLDKNDNMIKRFQNQTQRNLKGMASNQMGQQIQGQYQSFMEDGGNVALDGDLQVFEGKAKTLSYNPFLPNGGETVKFEGPSHAEGGMPITYGQSPIEVEGGEPAVKLEDGGSQENLVVFGNLNIPKNMLSDPNAGGKKFKSYINDLSKGEAKQNKIIETSMSAINEIKDKTPFEKLKLTTLETNIKGANMKLKSYAEKKQEASALQRAINDTAEAHGIDASSLSKGRFKLDKKIKGEKAQTGIYKNKGTSKGYLPYNDLGTGEYAGWKDTESYKNVWQPRVETALNDSKKLNTIISSIENYDGMDMEDVKGALAKGKSIDDKKNIIKKYATDQKIGPYHEAFKTLLDSLDTIAPEVKTTAVKTTSVPVYTPEASNTEEPNSEYEMIEATKRNPYLDIFNEILPHLRPTDQEQLDPNQLAGEIYALSNNQLEPVPAQGYRPQLDVPYDISYQDRLNEINADQRAAQKMSSNNPELEAMIAGQAYDSKSNVLGEQFRANQAMKDKVYSGNRATMNDAQLKNLDLYDQQYGRQSQAKSNTKDTIQTALNSISSKYAQNKLENKTLGVYENLYNYRYDKNGKAINMNPLVQFNTPTVGTTQPGLNTTDYEEYIKHKDYVSEFEEAQKERRKAEKSTKARNGSIVKALKTL